MKIEVKDPGCKLTMVDIFFPKSWGIDKVQKWNAGRNLNGLFKCTTDGWKYEGLVYPKR